MTPGFDNNAELAKKLGMLGAGALASSAVDLTNLNPQRNPHLHRGNDDGDGDGAHGAISLSGSLAWHGAAQPASDWYVAIVVLSTH